jgi:hypothetical protein
MTADATRDGLLECAVRATGSSKLAIIVDPRSWATGITTAAAAVELRRQRARSLTSSGPVGLVRDDPVVGAALKVQLLGTSSRRGAANRGGLGRDENR